MFIRSTVCLSKLSLLIDNAPTHRAADLLVSGDITATFLVPNVTALLQPMDQGVLENIKSLQMADVKPTDRI